MSLSVPGCFVEGQPKTPVRIQACGSSYAPGVLLIFKDEAQPPRGWLSLRLSPQETRALALRLLIEAGEADRRPV